MATKALTTLRLNPFRVDVQLAHNFACGGVEGSFLVECALSARDLTNEGFVVEVNSLIQEIRWAFNNGYMLVASCEQLAGGVVSVAHRLLSKRLERMTVNVQNLTGGVDLAWEKGNAVPAFPRNATREEIEATQKPGAKQEYC